MSSIAVVGIGADGWDGLCPRSRAEILGAEVLMGAHRQLDLIPESDSIRVPWPSPMIPALPGLFETYGERRICVVASGDPMLYGIGTTLATVLGPGSFTVIPHPSSVSLACAVLGWAIQDTEVVSAVNRPLTTVLPELTRGRQILVLSQGAETPAQLADLLTAQGRGGSVMTVLEQLGGPRERRVDGTAQTWRPGGSLNWQLGSVDPLNIVAVQCAADASPRLTRTPGLPDEVFAGDGQLTKQEMRALTVSALAPAPGELLWDVGGGSGSIAIEWMRIHRQCRAVSFERHTSRAEQIPINAANLGVPGLRVLGAAPAAFAEAPDPNAVFVGGGVTQPGLLEACWEHLDPGGRMVVNAVTAESESLLLRWFSEHGGQLRKLQIYRAGALGDFTAWKPQLPAVQWIGSKS